MLYNIIFSTGHNKPLFLELGVVDTGLLLLKHSTQAHVQLKAIGMLRLLSEKQGALCYCALFLYVYNINITQYMFTT